MSGTRSQDNCYVMNPRLKYNSVCLNESVLWHKKLGHVNYRNLEKLVKIGVVLGLPKLTSPGKLVCGDCLKGK